MNTALTGDMRITAAALDQLAINTIRTLSIDAASHGSAVRAQRADLGHCENSKHWHTCRDPSRQGQRLLSKLKVSSEETAKVRRGGATGAMILAALSERFAADGYERAAIRAIAGRLGDRSHVSDGPLPTCRVVSSGPDWGE